MAIEDIQTRNGPEPCQVLQDHLPQTPEDTLRFYAAGAGIDKVRGLQHVLTSLIEERKKDALREGASAEQGARLLSVAARGAGLFLTVTPSNPSLHMADEHFAAAARIRLGLQPAAMMPERCVCGREFKGMGGGASDHLLSCKSLYHEGTNRRHNPLAQVVNTIMRKAGAYVVAEPRNLLKDDGRRPDLYATFPHGMQETAVDVTVVHPAAETYKRKAAEKSLSAAGVAAKRKRARYQAVLADVGIRFIPFAVESFGGVCKEARAFMKELALQAAHCGPVGETAALLRREFGGMVSVAVQKGNAAMVLAGLAWAARVARRI